MIPAVWVPEGGALPGYPYEHIGRAVFIPDEEDKIGRMPSGSQRQRSTGPMQATATTSIAVTGQRDRRGFFAGSSNGDVGAGPSVDSARDPASGAPGRPGASGPGAAQWLADYVRPNVDEAIRAWNAMSDLRATWSALNATLALDLTAWVQYPRLNASGAAGLIGREGVAAGEQGISLDIPADKRPNQTLADGVKLIQVAGTTDPVIAAADLVSDELSGGHHREACREGTDVS